jgi:uncharacterized protein
MAATRQRRPSVEERLQAEFSLIRAQVAGVCGCVVATSDGFLVSHNVPDLDPTDLAALLAASRALASKGIAVTGRGEFREAISRGSHGYLAVYAAGESAIVAVIGDAELNVAMLHFRIDDVIKRIATYTPEFRRWSAAGPPAQVADTAVTDRRTAAGLPVRQRDDS